jgi:hypothetical protein
MFIKQFREQDVRIADPLRPGRRIFETRLNSNNNHSYVHDNVEYLADDEGWIEVPDEVGVLAKRFRGTRGERYFTPDEVDEEVVAGRIKPEEVEEPVEKPRKVPAKRVSSR